MFLIRYIYLLSILCLCCEAKMACPSKDRVDIFKSEPTRGFAKSQTIPCHSGFFGSNIDRSNGSSFEFWYFDMLADDATTALTLVFHVGSTPIDGGWASSNYIQVSGTFSNGSIFNHLIPAGTATISTVGNQSQGIWESSGFSWSTTADLEQHLITFSSPDGTHNGTINMNSVFILPCV
jgi:hypothetical protein